MRVVFLISALAAVAIAFPYSQETDGPLPEDPDEEPGATLITLLPTPTTPLIPSTSLNIPITAVPSTLPDPDDGDGDGDGDNESTTSRRRPHWEPLPIFSKKCHCQLATARYPCWATDALQRCHFEEVFSYGCYMQAFGGCPTPTRLCTKLFAPTPRPGRHPCELGTDLPLPSLITSAPWALLNTTTTVPVITSTIMIPGVPSPTANITFSVSIIPPVVTSTVVIPGVPEPSGNVTFSVGPTTSVGGRGIGLGFGG